MTEKKPFKILVADDEESLRGIVSEVLIDAGYEVECAEDGQKAIDMVKEKGDFHVVMTDIRMPELDGIELLEAIKEFNSNIQVVIMTSHGSLETAIKAIRLGAYDYLTKPFEDLDVISTVIDRTVERLRLEMQVQELVTELRARKEDAEALYTCTADLAKNLDLDAIIDEAGKSMLKLGRCEKVLYFKFDPETYNLCGFRSIGEEIKDFEKVTYEVAGAKKVDNYFVEINHDSELKKRMNLSEDPEKTVLFPMILDENVAGVFAVAGGHNWSPDQQSLLGQFVGNVSTQLEKAELHRQVSELAIRDGLTGLFNHRHFQNVLEQEIARAKRFKNKLAVILFDIDHFKKYNDQNGHPMGDQLLKEIGKLITDSVRLVDTAARYGGEEFVIIATENDTKGALILADRIREKVEKYPFQNAKSQPLGFVSISVGVAEFPAHGDTKQDLVEAADKALYSAKEGGRNKVVAAASK